MGTGLAEVGMDNLVELDDVSRGWYFRTPEDLRSDDKTS